MSNSYSGSVYRWDSDASAEPFRDWHRDYGRHLYATDLDFIEYTFSSTGVPQIAGMFEYKHVNGRKMKPDETQLQLLLQVATATEVPAFFVRYTTETPITYLLYPLDTRAAITKEGKNLLLSERQFARFLYYIRDLTAPSSVCHLSDEKQGLDAFPVDNLPYSDIPLHSPWAHTEATTASYA